MFKKESEFVRDNFLVVKGKWLADNIECYVVNVYAPQVESEKADLWNAILDFMNTNPGNTLFVETSTRLEKKVSEWGRGFPNITLADLISSLKMVH